MPTNALHRPMGIAVLAATAACAGAREPTQTSVVKELVFACVGDTRPPFRDDTESYPSAVISKIFGDIQAARPAIPFVLATGDYVFASTGAASQASSQLDRYLAARGLYAGAFFPALGNHECTGATASNCGPGAVDGLPAPYTSFAQKLLSPISQIAQGRPYYVVDATGFDGGWTAKFVFVAANAWSNAQAVWLEGVMSRPTTYTFVVRHEPASVSAAPGVEPSESILRRHTYTLAIVGHTHTYAHSRVTPSGPEEVVIGNGGAPLAAKDYGFGLFKGRPDGAVEIDMIHWETLLADPEFHFAVWPDGSPVASGVAP